MMRFIATLIFMSYLLFAAHHSTALKRVPLAIAKEEFVKIEGDAILLGHGDIDAYVFVDPLCPHSRNFIELITTNNKMLNRYRYRIFLLHLYKFDSKPTIEAIYAAKEPIKVLLDVMVHHKMVTLGEQNSSVLQKIGRIEQSASRLHVDRRPYLTLIKHKTMEP